MTAHEAERGPIFITGLDHSGKTQLRLLLGRSQSVFLTRRSELWTAPHPNHPPLDEPRGLRSCLASLLVRPAVAALVPDRDALVAEFTSGPATHARLFALIHARNAYRHGARRWGDQDSQLEVVARRLLAELPDAKVIHMVIDPRHRFAALERSWIRTPGLVGSATAAWVASARRGMATAAAHPDRYRVVLAETLADDTRVGDLLEWLAIDDVAPVGHGLPAGPPRVSRAERAFIEELAAEELAALGYAVRRASAVDARPVGARRILRDPLSWGRYAVRLRRELAVEEPSRRETE